VTTVAVLSVAVVLSAALAVRFGDQPVSLSKALADPRSTDALILWSLRLPRVVLAVLVGAALSASGAALQALTRNPLADPYVLGVSGGAALGATMAIALGWTAGLWGLSAPAGLAFLGALGATGVVFFAARRSVGPNAALLTGVIVNAEAAALITSIKALSAPDKLSDMLRWLVGALGYEPVSTLLAVAVIQVLALGILWAMAARLNLLGLGDDEASALGVPVGATRLWVLGAASLSVAAAVAVSGLVGFVGLLVPHGVRRVLGPDQRLLLPACALAGAAFLVLADLLARLAFRTFHAEPPVGVVTALAGGPLFLWLLFRTSSVRAPADPPSV
jgi:iron complex transport system permease protein